MQNLSFTELLMELMLQLHINYNEMFVTTWIKEKSYYY